MHNQRKNNTFQKYSFLGSWILAVSGASDLKLFSTSGDPSKGALFRMFGNVDFFGMFSFLECYDFFHTDKT